jgi:hypothetical protein
MPATPDRHNSLTAVAGPVHDLGQDAREQLEVSQVQVVQPARAQPHRHSTLLEQQAQARLSALARCALVRPLQQAADGRP